MNDLLEGMYPERPGYKRRDTSRQAAIDMAAKAPTLKERIHSTINGTSGLTADEACRKAGIELLSGRPRVSELANEGRLVDSGRRRRLESGKQGVVWKTTE